LVPEWEQHLKKGTEPIREVRANFIQRAKLTRQFRDLPQVMRHYADFLEGMATINGQYRKHPYNPLHHCLVAFTVFVHGITKSYMDAEISELANAVLLISDDHAKTIEPGNLAKLRRKNPRLRFPIKFD
jgi:hypothetical protein